MLHLEEEAERQKMELKSLIEIQKHDLQAKIVTLKRAWPLTYVRYPWFKF